MRNNFHIQHKAINMAAFRNKLALIAILASVVHSRVLLQGDNAVQNNQHDAAQVHNVTYKGDLKDEGFQLAYDLKIMRTNNYKAFMTFTSMDVVSGCGSDNQKCYCEFTNNPDALDWITSRFSMTGTGTQGTWTGLEFTWYSFEAYISTPAIHVSRFYTAT